MYQNKIITVVGGTGFLGRHVVKIMAEAGYTVRILCRNPEEAYDIKPAGAVGQIVAQYADISRPETLRGKLDNSYAVINLVGILFEKGSQSFTTLHAQGSDLLAQMAQHLHIPKFIQMSSLGVDKAETSSYAKTKLVGEQAVRSAFPNATIFRPSVIFGPEDNFFNQFAKMAVFSPFLPLIKGGNSKFQPVYVADVARAIKHAVEDTECAGHIYELGGPHIYTFKEILQFVRDVTRRRVMLMPMPNSMAMAFATFAELLPTPPLTRDQVRLLDYDNVVNPAAQGFEALGMSPASPELIVPEYLSHYKRNA